MISRVLILGISTAALLISHAVYATDIQMLPPVAFDGTEKTPCSGATAGLLVWDGATAIKCVPGTGGDISGNLWTQSNFQVGKTLLVGGAVGIGTAVPVHAFVVNNNTDPTVIQATGSNTNSISIGINNTSTGAHNWSIGAAGSAGASPNGSFNVYDATTSNARLVIDGSGNVGIGTTSPTNELTLAAGAQNVHPLYVNGYTSGIEVYGYQPQLDLAANSGDDFYFMNNQGALVINDRTASATRFIINSSGNVGIGSSSPLGNLDIENGSNNATLCLNNKCVSDLGGTAGSQGPQGPAGPAGPQGPAGATGASGATLTVSCPAGQMLAGLSNGVAVCKPASETIGTTVGAVNAACAPDAASQAIVEGYNALNYQMTCARRFCVSQGYVFGILDEAAYGYNYTTPYTSPSDTYVAVSCSH